MGAYVLWLIHPLRSYGSLATELALLAEGEGVARDAGGEAEGEEVALVG